MFKTQTIVGGLAVVMTIAVNIGVNPWSVILTRAASAFVIFFVLSWGAKWAISQVINASSQDRRGQNVDLRSFPGEDELIAGNRSESFQLWDKTMFEHVDKGNSHP